MKKLTIIVFCIFVLLGLCACNNSNTELENLKKEIETLKQENETLQNSQNNNISNENTKNDKLDNNNIPITPDNQKENILSAIWDFVQPEIAEKLKQPETAEFTDISKVKFFEISKNTYEVLGAIKGQNALGNLISNNFCVTVIVDSKGQPTMVNNVEFLSDINFEERISLNEQILERIASGKTYLTADELAEETIKQPLYVKETKYLDSNTFSYSSSSMLQAVLYNNSNVPIKSAVVAFSAWDKNNLPIKIKGYISISDDSYFSKINYSSINLMPGETYKGKDGGTYYGMQVDKDIQVSLLKAIVISYEDFDGNTWDNPLVLDFKQLYEEKRLLD